MEKKQGTEIKGTAPGRTTLEGGATPGPASSLKKVQGMKDITSICVFGLGMSICEMDIMYTYISHRYHMNAHSGLCSWKLFPTFWNSRRQ